MLGFLGKAMWRLTAFFCHAVCIVMCFECEINVEEALNVIHGVALKGVKVRSVVWCSKTGC